MNQTFDALVIGAGQAGPPLAERLGKAGRKVALIERHLLGGTCVNTGCTPTKALVASAYAAALARRSAVLGVDSGPVRVDVAKAMERAVSIAARSRGNVTTWMTDATGVTVIHGHARFQASEGGVHRVRVGDDLLEAPQVFIDVGGRASLPDMPGVRDVPLLNNSTLLATLREAPDHLVVVGGSYIGLEFAQVFRRFGARVTVVEKGPRLVSREDEDVSAAIETILVDDGIVVRTHAECIAFAKHADGIEVGVDCHSGEPTVVGSHVLLAVGRVPNTGDLGLDVVGVETDDRGYVRVDDHLATNVPGIWALGDCNGRGAFTHTSYNDYEIVAANLLDGEDRRVSARIPAYALYIDPPLGRVGLTETQARATGRTIAVSTRPMTRVGRAIEKGETQGFMKVVADAETQRILGASILGTGGDEAIHGFIDAMSADLPWTSFRAAVPVHPTVSELIPTLVEGLAT